MPVKKAKSTNTKTKKTVDASSKSATSAKTKKKTVAKKVAVKEKPIEITIHRKVFVEAPEGKHFFLGDGRVLKTLHDFAECLDSMADDVYYAHVSAEKNDFANWVGDVFEEKLLADELRRIQSKIDAQIHVLKHLVRRLSE